MGFGELLHVLFGFGFDSHGDDWFWNKQGFQNHCRSFFAEGVAGEGVFQTQGCSQVSGPEFINFYPIVGFKDN